MPEQPLTHSGSLPGEWPNLDWSPLIQMLCSRDVGLVDVVRDLITDVRHEMTGLEAAHSMVSDAQGQITMPPPDFDGWRDGLSLLEASLYDGDDGIGGAPFLSVKPSFEALVPIQFALTIRTCDDLGVELQAEGDLPWLAEERLFMAATMVVALHRAAVEMAQGTVETNDSLLCDLVLWVYLMACGCDPTACRIVQEVVKAGENLVLRRRAEPASLPGSNAGTTRAIRVAGGWMFMAEAARRSWGEVMDRELRDLTLTEVGALSCTTAILNVLTGGVTPRSDAGVADTLTATTPDASVEAPGLTPDTSGRFASGWSRMLRSDPHDVAHRIDWKIRDVLDAIGAGGPFRCVFASSPAHYAFHWIAAKVKGAELGSLDLLPTPGAPNTEQTMREVDALRREAGPEEAQRLADVMLVLTHLRACMGEQVAMRRLGLWLCSYVPNGPGKADDASRVEMWRSLGTSWLALALLPSRVVISEHRLMLDSDLYLRSMCDRLAAKSMLRSMRVGPYAPPRSLDATARLADAFILDIETVPEFPQGAAARRAHNVQDAMDKTDDDATSDQGYSPEAISIVIQDEVRLPNAAAATDAMARPSPGGVVAMRRRRAAVHEANMRMGPPPPPSEAERQAIFRAGTDLLDSMGIGDAPRTSVQRRPAVIEATERDDPGPDVHPLRPHLQVLDAVGDPDSEGEGKGRIGVRFANLLRRLPMAGVELDPDAVYDELRLAFPWMEDANLHVAGMVAVSAKGRRTAWLGRPLLLAGPPGCGKTRWAREVARILHLPFSTLSLAGAHTSMGLAGSERGWSGARPSYPAQAIQQLACPNPLILLDEVGRTSDGGHNGDVEDAMLPMIEPETGSRYPDKFLLGNLNLSQVSWVLTTNSLAGVSEPLVQRTKVVHAQAPKDRHLPQILDSVTRDVGRRLGLSEEVMADLGLDDLETHVRSSFQESHSIRAVSEAVEQYVMGKVWRPRGPTLVTSSPSA